MSRAISKCPWIWKELETVITPTEVIDYKEFCKNRYKVFEDVKNEERELVEKKNKIIRMEQEREQQRRQQEKEAWEREQKELLRKEQEIKREQQKQKRTKSYFNMSIVALVVSIVFFLLQIISIFPIMLGIAALWLLIGAGGKKILAVLSIIIGISNIVLYYFM